MKVGIDFNKDADGKKISKFKVLSFLKDKKEALVLVESDYSKNDFLNHPGVLSVEENGPLLVNRPLLMLQEL